MVSQVWQLLTPGERHEDLHPELCEKHVDNADQYLNPNQQHHEENDKEEKLYQCRNGCTGRLQDNNNTSDYKTVAKQYTSTFTATKHVQTDNRLIPFIDALSVIIGFVFLTGLTLQYFDISPSFGLYDNHLIGCHSCLTILQMMNVCRFRYYRAFCSVNSC